MRRLHLDELWVRHRARLQLIGRLLEPSIDGASNLPAKTDTLPPIVLGKLTGDFVELGAVTQLGYGFFLLGMFFALHTSG